MKREVQDNALPVPVLPMAFFDMAGVNDSEHELATFPSFQKAFEHFNHRILLLGEPRSGKTTTLMSFARDSVWKRLENSRLPLPIIVPVATWDAELEQSMESWLGSTVAALKDDIDTLLRDRNLLLILDGLDELGSIRENALTGQSYDPRERFLDILSHHHQIVLSCRVNEYEELNRKTTLSGAVRLQPLDDVQLREYLRDMPEL